MYTHSVIRNFFLINFPPPPLSTCVCTKKKKIKIEILNKINIYFSVHNAPRVMETVGKQVQVVSGLGVVGPVGGDLHHHHHHSHPHGGHSHSLVGGTSTPARVQTQTHQGQPPPSSHNQHLPPRSTPIQHHRWVSQIFIGSRHNNIASFSVLHDDHKQKKEESEGYSVIFLFFFFHYFAMVSLWWCTFTGLGSGTLNSTKKKKWLRAIRMVLQVYIYMVVMAMGKDLRARILLFISEKERR